MTGSASPQPTHTDPGAQSISHDQNGRLSDTESSDSLSDLDGIIEEAEFERLIHPESAQTSQKLPSPDPDAPSDASVAGGAQTNGHANEADASEDEGDGGDGGDGRPSKRRRIRDTTPTRALRRPKPESPPWKRVAAEGPTSFTEGGRRKSGRINTIPLELQHGEKRVTRRSLNGSAGSPPSKTTSTVPKSQSAPNVKSNGLRRPASVAKTSPSKTTADSKAPARKPPVYEPRTTPRARKRTPSPAARPTPTRVSTRTRYSSRAARERIGEPSDPNTSPNMRQTRIKLRVRPPTIPFIHPEQANVRPKLGPNFEGYFERAVGIPVEEGGMLVPEDGPRFTDEMAQKEAGLILRIEREVQPGGMLSEEHCSVFEPEAAEEPPRQWVHMDHLVKAMANFRKLMVMEQQRHRATAKKLAEACRDEWLRRQPKTAEELEAEARTLWIGRYRLVMRAMFGTWDNVKIEINKRRLAEWEAEEQKRVRAALQQAVDKSEQQLQQRRAHFDSEGLSDEGDLDEDESEDDEGLSSEDEDAAASGSHDGSDSDEDMSSSEEDDDHKSVMSDEGLTQDQLRKKYADIPAFDTTPADGDFQDGDDVAASGNEEDSMDDTSDESVDMDDDLGSTDMDSGDEDDDASDGDVDESDKDDEPNGLLGLFFGKSELQKMKEEQVTEQDPPEAANAVPTEPAQDTPMIDAVPEITATSNDAINGNVERSDGSAMADGAQGEQIDSHPSELATECAERQSAQPDTPERPKVDGTSAHQQSPSHGIAPRLVNGEPEDVDMTDGVAPQKQLQGSETAPGGASHLTAYEAKTQDGPASENVTDPTDAAMADAGPPTEARLPSPETDGITNPPSRDRSQSPRTSDTKPSDIETTSLEQASGQKEPSRSTSPGLVAAKTQIPFLLRGTLREYQHNGLDWLAGLYANNTNGILADEMGLGKTIQTIALLAHLACHHEVWGPHLVIVPTSVMLNWEMEFKKWCPGFKILTYYGNQEERRRKRNGWTNDDVWNVCITSYQMVLQDQQVFRRRRWHYMILDEAHNIKNFKSQRWQTLLGFNTQARLLLTGTPLQNNLTELWSLLFFLMPSENGVGGFADLNEFRDWFHRPESQILESGREQMDDEARAIIAKLHKVLRPYLLRRLKADVEKQMPAKYEHVEFCRLSKRQRELYDGFLSRTDTRETLSSGNYLSIINCLMQLRKVCNHPDLFIDRPIMTSWRMQRSVPCDYESTEHLIRGGLLAEKPMSVVNLGFLNLVPTQHEELSLSTAERISQLSSHRILLDLKDAQKARAQHTCTNLDPESVKSNVVYLDSASRWGRFEELQHCLYLNALRRQQRPIYGKWLRDFLTVGIDKRPYKPRPRVPAKVMSWLEEDSFLLRTMLPTMQQRAGSMEMIVSKFACVTPAVVTRDMNRFLLGPRGVKTFEEWDLKLSAPIKTLPFVPKEPPADPWHEARMRLTIQFPDKRLLQYDCGKLQALDRLLRRLEAGGHRALIFTQMTKVLDILEQFLNIHGHKYLRLDGATKVEQRQILTDRFNHDTRILCFILSTRSGGLGINLTGADTVIFYDQDWNPAMDKQCQDRCHRIGQTRDVHIYRLVSEHTIEANILRKASQKQMLDDIVIQEGEFTTDYFNKLSVRDVIGTDTDNSGLLGEGDAVANAAMDRILGGVESTDQRTAGRALEQAEDREDVTAARAAEREIQADDADFAEKPNSGAASGLSSAQQGTPRDGTPAAGRSGLSLFSESAYPDVMELDREQIEYNAYGEPVNNIDDYMLKLMSAQLKDMPLEIPKDKKKSKKKGKDTRKR